MTTRVIHAVVVLTVLPLLTLRGKWLWRYLAIDLATYAVAALAWGHVDHVPGYAAAVGLVVFKVAVFSLFLAVATDVRWSANRAAIVSLLVYSLLIPAMSRAPIDGDEPFYLLVTESIVRDFDLDLANQYRDLSSSASGRLDLKPQPGDPVGANGAQYSRHEPLLPILMIPGYLFAGLPGALATIVIFAALLVRSTMRLLEDEGVDEASTRAVFPFFAFGPPIVFYAARIWPEVPAAFFFVEAIRGVRQQRPKRWVPALLFLSLIKLRFVLVAIPLVVKGVAKSRRHAVMAAAIVAVPLLVLWMITGSATNVHTIRDLVAPSAGGPLHGTFGLVLDGAAGIAFQAPFYLLAVFALVRWRELPAAARLGLIASLPYLILLVPRSEWHGGWSPPLRYIVFLMPVLALCVASLMSSRASARDLGGRGREMPVFSATLGILALFTMGLVTHGVSWPWRLFHIANGENVPGETLSRLYGTDFSRLFPSFIRLNHAAIVTSVVLVIAIILFARWRERHRVIAIPASFLIAGFSMILAAWFLAGQQPGDRVEFEDAHVTRDGGELFPHQFTVARFAHRGGWILHEGQSLSFLVRPGAATLHYASGAPSTIQIGKSLYHLPAASAGYRTVRVRIATPARVVLRCVRGSVNLDRLDSD